MGRRRIDKKLNNLNVFSTRIIMIEDVFDDLDLSVILDQAKAAWLPQQTEEDENEGSPTYKTSYSFANIQEKLFEPVKTQINNSLADESLNFEFSQAIWWSEYGEYDQHGPHTHDQTQWDMMYLKGALKYSGIVNLSNIGKTMFVNPNPTSYNPQQIAVNSTYGSVLIFPSNLIHYVPQHRKPNKLRNTFSFNGLLRGLENHEDLEPIERRQISGAYRK